MNRRDESNSLPPSKRMHVDLTHEPSSETMVDDSEYSYSDNNPSEDPLIPTNDIHVVDNRSYCIRPARILISVEEFVNCKYISEMLQSLCKQVGLLVSFDVYSNEFTLIDFLNANKYDLVFIHQTLIYGKHGDHLILNLRCLLSFTPVIIVGLSSNYASLMSLCDFTAFLRVPFTDADLLHYILKYVFEVYEAKVFQTDLQKIPKKRRLRFDGFSHRGFF
ncbi:uncharacterized protein [Blastocystis hominis]|uniref:Response regulatory domain-containing protein n=1 Tax=Blastocystis hominis TaxID=12968 RepID=D8LVC8_BLAHO|nr:uncharacterized protein [Blastocystis hominis]CBK19767.2 unnamed protein product [Blastocystis hominis]|eukprot:XP_012893815.1 uncharacterized protein [Blastocystis hominis]